MFEIKKATRVGIAPLIALYGESGTGKSYSALLLARGMAGADGLITACDSESGRLSLYADVIPGGFGVFEITAPFSPARYVEAVDAIESSGAAVGLIDSGSHEWEGAGGVLDMAVDIEEKTGRKGLHCWKVPKFEHAKFIQRLLRTKIPLIVCLRAKYKSRQIKGTAAMAENGEIDKRDIGKTIILKDQATSPIQAEDFIFEATCHAEILQNHSIIVTKCSHPSLRQCFPDDKTTPITIEHGKMLAQWCAAAGAQPTTGASTKKPVEDTPLQKAMAELWKLMKPIRKDARDFVAINHFLWQNEILDPAKEPIEQLPGLPLEKVQEIISKLKTKPELLQ